MKQYTLLGLILLLMMFVLGGTALAQGPLVPDGEPGEFYYAPFPLQITLDGDISDWEGVPRVLMSDDGDPEIRFAAASDGEYIYFLADVTDSTIISGTHGANYWDEDSVEFYINGTGDFGLRAYTSGVAQVTVPALNADLGPDEPAVLSGVQGSSANANVRVVYTDTGYRVEMAVPLENDVWTIEAQHGNAIGFQVHLNGASEISRDTKLIWSNRDTSDQSYINPGLFGYLIFYEVGQTDLPEPPVVETSTASSLPPVDASALYRNGRLPAEARIIDLMARMTLEEKIGQMTLVEKNSLIPGDITVEYIGGVLSGGGGYPTGDNTPEGWAAMVNGYQDEALATRLGIPIIYGVDAVHGHSNVYSATIFPHNIGLGAANNADLVREVCRLTAIETAATGIYWNYAPVLAVAQDIRWGRTYESYSENTDLVATLSLACMQGLQGENLADPLTVLATPKHYVGDGGAEWGTSTTGDYIIDQGFVNIDEATLRAVHLAPYLPALENGALSVMVSYTGWNGTRMHAEGYLINDVLKGELGFEGFVVSDWAGVDMVSTDYYEAVVASINAGIDMNMVPYDYIRFIETVKSAVNNGDISISRIDDAVRRILLVKFRMGLFENPYANLDNLSLVGAEEHRAVARQAVAESAVLLQNNNDVLPIAPDVSTILVAGVGADDIGMQSGGWTIEWQGGMGPITIGTTIFQGLVAAAPEGTTVLYDATGTFADRTETAEIGIVVVGERPYAEGRGDDGELALLPEDLAAIEALRPQVEQLVVVILSGRPLIITDYLGDWDAVVAAWLPGTEGHGVADVLFGYQPFTGTLSFTWPASIEQLPQISATEPLFSFGYGLTTTAQYE